MGMDTLNCSFSLILVLYIVSFDNWEPEARLDSWEILLSDFLLDGGQELVIFWVLSLDGFLHTSPSDSLLLEQTCFLSLLERFNLLM
ncbi:hypothetical protein BO82DRAFT_21585 [Aspergillus uvarum CBS 121591]|uniref:Uncharacterized protein n=1 Tax=Aspergillus uvarum CBS 121591 TaxID=1448315 RepID=A0A319BS40_9EURO|nr:hypothetical protein BO82DRAFT_21585 [Aspergillus uvarum CBS 121591]PYH75495.1 hypothetical protein BO82DRAFT_21585 [Aspergillus uvarum CBS 121591]